MFAFRHRARLLRAFLPHRHVASKVPLQSIKALRERTGAPITAVKDALEQHAGDLEAAMDHLRKLGAALMADRAHRRSDDGLVTLVRSSDGCSVALVHLSSETDFVARTPQFSQLAHTLAQITLQRAGSMLPDKPIASCELDAQAVLAGGNASDLVAEAVAALGENIAVKKAVLMSASPDTGGVATYVHRAVNTHSGKIGVVVAMEGQNVDVVGRRIAMHVAAANPQYLSVSNIPTERVEKEKMILMDATRMEGETSGKEKPSHVIQRIVEGRLNKLWSEVVLEEQEMMVEEDGYSGKPRSVIKSMHSEAPSSKIVSFVRVAVGDGEE